MLPFAFGVALSPMPIVAIVLMLITPQAKTNGLAFLGGWIAGIAIAGAIVLAVAHPSDTGDTDDPATWVSWLKLVLAVLLVLVAIKEWKARPAPGEDVAMPKWMGMLNGITAVKAAGLAVVLSALNPKNLVFIIGGATAIALTGVSGGEQAVSWAVFTVIASIGVAAPVVIYFALGDKANAKLNGLKDWMARNNTAMMGVLCLIIGVKLLGDAISGLFG
ncbi:MAG: GAP family protein [Thermomicrobiales bacterium]